MTRGRGRSRLGKSLARWSISLAALALSACASTPFPHLHVYPLPQPVSFAGEAIPVSRPSVEVRISDWYNYYLARPWIIAAWLERGEQIFPIIDATLEEYGLPEDLKYVAVAESYLNPRAYSYANAAGIWQFIPSTAKRYDLFMNNDVDARYDYIAATHAAAEYLRQAHSEIGGSWLLAVAAYNLGATAVIHRIERQRSRDFWSMVFPQQTESYVPRIIAIKLLMQHAAELAVTPRIRMPPLFPISIDTAGKPIFLADVNRFLGMTFRDLWVDNPQVQAPFLPPGQYRFYLPVEVEQKAAGLSRYLGSLPYKKITYLSPGGETVAATAAQLGISAEELAAFNDLQSGTVLAQGQEVSYWVASPSGIANN